MLHDLAWFAGIFEGEGCITCNKIKGRKNSFHIGLCICSTDKDVIETCGKIYPTGFVKGPYKASYPNGKLRYTWEIQNQKGVLNILEDLLPFLHSRRKTKALSTIQIIKERIHVKENSSS